MAISRDLILAHASELIVTRGLDQFSMRSLAGSLGVSAPALYRHFTNREAILFEVTSQAVSHFAQYMYRSLSGAGPRERFMLSGQEYMNFALDHPRFYEVIHLSRDLMGRADPPRELVAAMCATGQFLVDRVRECMEAGLLRTGDPHERALTIWAHSHGLVSLYLRGFIQLQRPEFEKWFHRSFATIFAGLGEPEVDWRTGTEAPAMTWPSGGLSATAKGNRNRNQD
jgi:AcrR family transcriptional regulator